MGLVLDLIHAGLHAPGVGTQFSHTVFYFPYFSLFSSTLIFLLLSFSLIFFLIKQLF